MELIDAVNKAKELMIKHDLHDWSFKLNTNKRRLGVCKYRLKRIELSIYHVVKDSEKEVTNTILHEIAHALTPGHMHDDTWIIKAVEIGCDGKRCGSDMQVKTNWKGTCINCGLITYKHRRRTTACRKCCTQFNNGIFSLKYLFCWTPNE